jgi:hypothetical protein
MTANGEKIRSKKAKKKRRKINEGYGMKSRTVPKSYQMVGFIA